MAWSEFWHKFDRSIKGRSIRVGPKKNRFWPMLPLFRHIVRFCLNSWSNFSLKTEPLSSHIPSLKKLGLSLSIHTFSFKKLTSRSLYISDLHKIGAKIFSKLLNLSESKPNSTHDFLQPFNHSINYPQHENYRLTHFKAVESWMKLF